MSVKLNTNPLVEKFNEQIRKEEADARRKDENTIKLFESATGLKVAPNQAQTYHEIANMQRDIKVIEQFESATGTKIKPEQAQTYLRLVAMLRNVATS